MVSSLYVITGGPHCGKSTVIGEFVKSGYMVVSEVARPLIEWNQKFGGPLPSTDFVGFEREVMIRQKKREAALRGLDEIVFADRGMSDIGAYFLANKVFDIPLDISLEMHRHKYAGVFILDPLPNYKNDAQRLENPALANAIHEQMYGAYLVTGHQPVFVPVMPVADRVKFIQDYISKPKREAA